MKKKTISFDDALAALDAPAAPTARTLRGLSNLEPDQVAELQVIWPRLGNTRRAYVVEKLREMAEEDIELDFTLIFRFALSDVEERVRLSAVEGLWEDESLSLIDLLVVLVRSDPSPLVRAASATALGRFLYLGEVEKISRYRRDQVYSALMGALMSAPPGSVIYQQALESLAYVSNEEVERLIREAYASENQALRATAVFAMGRSNEHKYSDLVRRELHSVLPSMRVEAARACGELEIAAAVPELGRLLEDPNDDVVVTAIGALGQIGGDEARKILERAAASDDEEIAEAAEDALADDEFMHGDLKFSTSWFDDLRQDGVGEKDDGM